MSMPIIPDRTMEKSLIDIHESIALEETSLAHLINAEAEKVQAIAPLIGNVPTEEITALQKSVIKAIQSAIKMQMLLQFKLENVLEYLSRFIRRTILMNTVTAVGFYNGQEIIDTDIAYYYIINNGGENNE